MARCSHGQNIYHDTKQKEVRCSAQTAPGSIFCEEHRAEKLASIQNKASKRK